MTEQLTHPLRSDAQENRERILAAARDVFAAEGLDVPMRAIARRAGVGPATLYRHFPAKQALAREAFAEETRACRAVVADGLADPDPWRGFCSVIERICELHARNRGFTEAFVSAFPREADLASERDRALTAMAELAGRAQRAGRLRADFVLSDVMLVLMANDGIRAASAPGRLAASRRFAALAIRAFAA